MSSLPINITSNEGLDAYCNGNGTDGLSWSSAHHIEDFYIETGATGCGIAIANTNRCLNIRNCIIQIAGGSGYWEYGIFLGNCSNVNISSCQIIDVSEDYYHTTGINVGGSFGIRVWNNSVIFNSMIADHMYGIEIIRSNFTEVSANTISGNPTQFTPYYSTVYYGMWVIESCNTTLAHNIFTGTFIDHIELLYLDQAINTTVTENDFLGDYTTDSFFYCTEIYECEGTFIEWNRFAPLLNTTDDVYAIYTHHSNNTWIHQNNFTGQQYLRYWSSFYDVQISDSTSTIVQENIMQITLNKEYGHYNVYLDESSNCTLLGNTMVGSGIRLVESSPFVIDSFNTINGKQILYYKDQTEVDLSGIENSGQLILYNCSDVNLTDMEISTRLSLLYCEVVGLRINAPGYVDFTNGTYNIGYSTLGYIQVSDYFSSERPYVLIEYSSFEGVVNYGLGEVRIYNCICTAESLGSLVFGCMETPIDFQNCTLDPFILIWKLILDSKQQRSILLVQWWFWGNETALQLFYAPAWIDIYLPVDVHNPGSWGNFESGSGDGCTDSSTYSMHIPWYLMGDWKFYMEFSDDRGNHGKTPIQVFSLPFEGADMGYRIALLVGFGIIGLIAIAVIFRRIRQKLTRKTPSTVTSTKVSEKNLTSNNSNQKVLES